MSDFIIVKTGKTGEYEEKKSRFIANVYAVESESQAAEYIEAARKKYWDAKHNCYAYVIGDNNEITRCSDDKEPSGTAGKPILEVILGREIHNCLIIVTRYFGGTLLGTGGLVRAYTSAAKEGIEASDLRRVVPGVRYIIDTDYNGAGKIQYAADTIGAGIEDTEYTDKVRLRLVIEQSRGEELVKKLTEITNGRAVINKDCDLPIEELLS